MSVLKKKKKKSSREEALERCAGRSETILASFAVAANDLEAVADDCLRIRVEWEREASALSDIIDDLDLKAIKAHDLSVDAQYRADAVRQAFMALSA